MAVSSFEIAASLPGKSSRSGEHRIMDREGLVKAKPPAGWGVGIARGIFRHLTIHNALSRFRCTRRELTKMPMPAK